MVEEDPFGEIRYHVSFDHRNELVPTQRKSLQVTADSTSALMAGSLGDVSCFSRKIAAGVIVSENNQTGCFLRTSIEPLPHQAFLLEKIISGNFFGHLLADDVGLGKTIEAGLILMTLAQRNPRQKVLIICPSGLCLQWQEEMEDHFAQYFSVLGRDSDFSGKTPASWQGRSHVIASIDRLKRQEYREVLRTAGPFDLVICDEAHRLTAKREFLSGDLRTTANYRLFRELVEDKVINYVVGTDGAPRSPSLILLSATPHQGDDLRFGYLLKLIRPDLFPQNDESISEQFTFEKLYECVTRTPKSKAVDWQKRKIFIGHECHTVDIVWSNQEAEASIELTRYIQESLRQQLEGGRGASLVLELVMHTFHKIAASSWPALLSTLKVRRERLRVNAIVEEFEGAEDEDEEAISDIQRGLSQPEFFECEATALESLIEKVESLEIDSKWEECQALLDALEKEQPAMKVLFFTQYRLTQRYLQDRLWKRYGEVGVELINGDVGLAERKVARKRFEGTSRFMISTEAGGEGVNLQKACHLMVNYDLPWNPMRLQQRIGRLDRYGQKNRVSVFNLRVLNSWDNRISTRIIERLDVIQNTLGSVLGNPEDYREMILGSVADRIESTRMFSQSMKGPENELSDEEVDGWIQQAVESAKKWKQIIHVDLGLPSADALQSPELTSKDFEQCYRLLLEKHSINLSRTRADDVQKIIPGVFHFEPPKEFREPVVRVDRQRYIVFDREIFDQVRGQVITRRRGQEIRPGLVGFGEPFTDWLFERVFEARDSESAFCVEIDKRIWPFGSGWLRVASLRWQGSSRRINTPDSIVGCFQSDGTDHWQILQSGHLMALAINVKQGGPFAWESSIGNNGALQLVRGVLKDSITRHGGANAASAGWSWLLAARVSCPE